MPSDLPPEPWRSFLAALDGRLARRVDLHCIGGFAVTVIYGAPRSTVHLDGLALIGADAADPLALARRGGELHRQFGVYLDRVAVVTPPEDYESRLAEVFAAGYAHVHLWAPDPYDLALCKLGRNSQRDRDDVPWLARQPGFDVAIIRERYQRELRSRLIGRPKRTTSRSTSGSR